MAEMPLRGHLAWSPRTPSRGRKKLRSGKAGGPSLSPPGSRTCPSCPISSERPARRFCRPAGVEPLGDTSWRLEFPASCCSPHVDLRAGEGGSAATDLQNYHRIRVMSDKGGRNESFLIPAFPLPAFNKDAKELQLITL